MKAVVVEGNGRSRKLVYRDVEKPVIGEQDLLVQVVCTGINAADYRSLGLGIIPRTKIFGADIAGKVVEVGAKVKSLRVGDEVVGDIVGAGFGGFAEFARAPEHMLVKKPAELSFEQAAAIPMAASTALQGLRDLGKIRSGQKVLIYGAGGGVGNFAVQLAKYYGTTVTGVCGTQNVELVRSLGADRVVDYTREDIITSGETFDLILGVNGYQPLNTYRRLLSPGGTYVGAGGALKQVFKAMLFGPFLSLGSRKLKSLSEKPNQRDLQFNINLAAQGKIHPVIDRTYPLVETAEAMRYAGQGHSRGKVVINVADR
jgi:NADPH:quinone reductase-like Zn-dependent oxidoreductase